MQAPTNVYAEVNARRTRAAQQPFFDLLSSPEFRVAMASFNQLVFSAQSLEVEDIAKIAVRKTMFEFIRNNNGQPFNGNELTLSFNKLQEGFLKYKNNLPTDQVRENLDDFEAYLGCPITDKFIEIEINSQARNPAPTNNLRIF